MQFLRRIRHRRRRRFFAAKCKELRGNREAFNHLFEDGHQRGRYALAPTPFGFGYYLAVRNGKKLKRWDLCAKLPTLQLGINALIAYAKHDKGGVA